jgi:hypothetical protein
VVRARTGDEGVELPCEVGATLRLTADRAVVDGTTRGTWRLVEEGRPAGTKPAGIEPVWMSEDGRQAEFAGLDPGARYAVHVLGAPGSRWGRVDGVAPGDGSHPVVSLRPGESIVVRPSAGGTIHEPWAVATPEGGGPEVEATHDDGALRFDGLPPGRWRVRVQAVVDDEDSFGLVELESGTMVDVPLVPDDAPETPRTVYLRTG